MFEITFTTKYNRSDWVGMADVIKRVASLIADIDDLFLTDVVVDFKEEEYD